MGGTEKWEYAWLLLSVKTGRHYSGLQALDSNFGRSGSTGTCSKGRSLREDLTNFGRSGLLPSDAPLNGVSQAATSPGSSAPTPKRCIALLPATPKGCVALLSPTPKRCIAILSAAPKRCIALLPASPKWNLRSSLGTRNYSPKSCIFVHFSAAGRVGGVSRGSSTTLEKISRSRTE